MSFLGEDWEEGMVTYLDLTSPSSHPTSKSTTEYKGIRQSYYNLGRIVRKGKTTRSIQRAIQRALDREKN